MVRVVETGQGCGGCQFPLGTETVTRKYHPGFIRKRAETREPFPKLPHEAFARKICHEPQWIDWPITPPAARLA